MCLYYKKRRNFNMSVDTIARHRGKVTHEEIIEFVKEKFNCKVRTGIHTEHYEFPNVPIFANYNNSKTWDTTSGYIDLIIDDTGERNRSIYYSYGNLNLHENYLYYSKNHPELVEMVCAETTYLSLGHNEQAIKIIGTIVDEFGGWFCESDASGTFHNVIGRREKEQDFSHASDEKAKDAISQRVDIMTDIETLGKDDGAPVFQISAVKFDICTGKIISTFNETVDISNMKNIEGGTLLWWLNTNKELLSELLNKGKKTGYSEEDVVRHFVDWVNTDMNNSAKRKTAYLWGNGVLFDNRLIKNKCQQYGIEYPIHYRNDRDMRTIVELAAYKTGFESEYAYRESFPNIGKKHDAFDDVTFQVKVLCKAFDVLQNN